MAKRDSTANDSTHAERGALRAAYVNLCDDTSLVLDRAYSVLDLLFTLAAEKENVDSELGLCANSLVASLDVAMTHILEAKKVLANFGAADERG